LPSRNGDSHSSWAIVRFGQNSRKSGDRDNGVGGRTAKDNGIYHVTLLIIAIRLKRGQRGADKTLWGSPAEQTREKMLVVKVK